jgi:hypothetical protein
MQHTLRLGDRLVDPARDYRQGRELSGATDWSVRIAE